MTIHTHQYGQDESALWLLHITDNHLFEDAADGSHRINSTDTLRKVLDFATRARLPDLVVESGDVANDSTREVYETFAQIVAEYVDCPVIATPGNHDLNAPFDQVLSRESISMKGWRVVTVDTHTDGELSGFVSPEEFERIGRELARDPSPTLVMGHHPATEIGSVWIDAHRISNGKELLQTLATYPQVKAYLCGHVHQAFDGEAYGVKLMTTPSTCWQFKAASREFAIDDLPAGWRWLALREDGQINTMVERLDITS